MSEPTTFIKSRRERYKVRDDDGRSGIIGLGKSLINQRVTDNQVSAYF